MTSLALLIGMLALAHGAVGAGTDCAAVVDAWQPNSFRGAPRVLSASIFDDASLNFYYATDLRVLRRWDGVRASPSSSGPTGPTADVLAGNVTNNAVIDGPFATAMFSRISSVTIHHTGLTTVVIVFDAGRIRKVDLGGSVVTTIAGSGIFGTADGNGTSATFLNDISTQLFVPPGTVTLFVSQFESGCVREVNLNTFSVRTVAGTCGSTSSTVRKPGPMAGAASTTGVLVTVATTPTSGKILTILPGAQPQDFATYTELGKPAAMLSEDGVVYLAFSDKPCELYVVKDAKVVRQGAAAVPAGCSGVPQSLISSGNASYHMAMGGNNAVTSPIWAMSDCADVPSAAAGDETVWTTPLIIGLSVGGVVLLLLIAVVVLALLLMRKRHPPQEVLDQSNEPMSTVAFGQTGPHGDMRSGAYNPALNGTMNSSMAAEALMATLNVRSITSTGMHSDRVGLKPAIAESTLGSGGGMVIAEVTRGDFGAAADPATVAIEMRKHNERCDAVKTGHYQKGVLMGRGANGSVFTVMLKDGSTIALKEISLVGSRDEIAQQTGDVEREMKMLSTLRHPNIVTYYGAMIDEPNLQVKLFMELITGGSVGGLVRGLDDRLNGELVQRFMIQIVDGLAFMHGRGIVHRDLKADNVLIDTNTGTVKLADFGTAKSLGNQAGASRAAQTMIGTPLFMAPEVLMPMMSEEELAEDETGYGMKADIWSLGIMVAEVLNKGLMPWPNFMSPGHAFMHINSDKGIPIPPEGIAAQARDFIEQCTRRDPKARPSAAELVLHPWLLGDDAVEIGSVLPGLVADGHE
jgi:tRNA A-37 threonylcarbamoyl transferase component Bud32